MRHVMRACAAVMTGATLAGIGVLGSAGASAASTAGPGASTAVVAGARLWVSRYDGPGNGLDIASAVAVTRGGGKVFVTGTSERAAATIAYNTATGARLWVKRYGGPGDRGANGQAVAVSPDGGTVFMAGFSTGAGSGDDYVTIAYKAATGARRWLARYNGPAGGGDEAFALAVSPDGKTVFVTGQSSAASSGADYATVAYNAATGAPLWSTRYGGPGTSYDSARSLAIGPGGRRLFVSGFSAGANSAEVYATVAYDTATGKQLWAGQYQGPGVVGATSVTVSPGGGRVYVAETSGITAATLAYDAATGARLWARRYQGQGGHGAFAAKVAVSPDGRTVYTAATSGQMISQDFATIAYEASTGAQKWLRLYNGTANNADDATALAVSQDGTVYVTGASSAARATDYATIAYSASGKRLWVSRYNGPVNGEDRPAAIAVSSAGREVFVTGRSLGPRTTGQYQGFDYATVAYAGSGG
ncbi:MAG TPA: PQQ-binding-like beta-propeller repeat protein [Streptosporangiaceae bacterium]